jgi:hypothetical protein
MAFGWHADDGDAAMSDKLQSQIGCLSDAPADEALVLAAKNGDEYAFEELVKRHQKKILAVSMQ